RRKKLVARNTEVVGLHALHLAPVKGDSFVLRANRDLLVFKRTDQERRADLLGLCHLGRVVGGRYFFFHTQVYGLVAAAAFARSFLHLNGVLIIGGIVVDLGGGLGVEAGGSVGYGDGRLRSRTDIGGRQIDGAGRHLYRNLGLLGFVQEVFADHDQRVRFH